VQEKGVSRIESYMYEDHPMLKRAAVQLINNLLFSDEVVKMFEGKNDRTKYLVLVCADDDLELVQAAIGGLAVLTALSKRASKKVFDAKEWKDTFCYLMTHENKDIQIRAVAMVCNVIKHSKALAEKMLEKEVLQVLDVLVKLERPDSKVREQAQMALDAAEKWKLVEKNTEVSDEEEES